MAEQDVRGNCMTATINSLETLTGQAASLEAVRKKDLRCGDHVLVETRNSLYTVWVLGNEEYWVWGGWFDLRGLSPHRISINGCTWGGTAILRGVVAARGLRLEFGNRVVTTQIQKVSIIRADIRIQTN
jgi:hypothetical protein